mgnify:CR=1 FL=1
MKQKYRALWNSYYKNISNNLSNNILESALYNTQTSETGNLVVILKDDSVKSLASIGKYIKKIIKKVPTPLFISRKYIETSLDSYPLEFLNIYSDYEIMEQKHSIISQLKFDKEFIRLQIERELKGKLILIKTALLENYKNEKTLNELIKVSFSSIIPVLKGFIFLLGLDIPKDNNSVIKLSDEKTDFSIQSFKTANEIFEGKNIKKLDISINSFFDEYTDQLNRLSLYVDALEINRSK